MPLRQTRNTKKRIKVDSKIVRANGLEIDVDYRLVLVGGEWKVYDFSVDNISMIISYRSQFADVLAQKGMGGLIQKLQSKSKRT